jgi:hypothetical protein
MFLFISHTALKIFLGELRPGAIKKITELKRAPFSYPLLKGFFCVIVYSVSVVVPHSKQIPIQGRIAASSQALILFNPEC